MSIFKKIVFLTMCCLFLLIGAKVSQEQVASMTRNSSDELSSSESYSSEASNSSSHTQYGDTGFSSGSENACDAIKNKTEGLEKTLGYYYLSDLSFKDSDFGASCVLTYPDTLRANLDLNGSTFEGSNMQGVNISNAMIPGVSFKGADLSNAIMDKVNGGASPAVSNNSTLTGASFKSAQLNNCCFKNVVNAEGANFSNSQFLGATLEGGNFQKAIFNILGRSRACYTIF